MLELSAEGDNLVAESETAWADWFSSLCQKTANLPGA